MGTAANNRDKAKRVARVIRDFLRIKGLRIKGLRIEGCKWEGGILVAE